MTRISVVTGAAGGLGTAISARLIADGFVTVGLDVDETALKRTAGDLGSDFHPHPCDVSNPDSVKAAFADLSDRFEGLDVLVNNAGTCFMSEFPDIPPAEFERQMAVNFHSAFHCCQAAVPLLLDRGRVTKIVNISSNGAYNFDVFDPPHYRASKAAMDTLTKDLARRYARDRIAVNSIAPAMTETPLFDVVPKATLDRAIAAMPHGRPMRPSEVADWVGFLASPAGDICSGNVIVLNQGRDVR
ncbi:MAG: SDR family oxidoreductase [Pseudomonadota bacterium]